jgi:nitrile hydratase accessory protein
MADGSTYQRRRNLVTRHADGRLVNVARSRGQLFVCANNCCCGRVEDGFAPVPVDLYHAEWERRRLRNYVHLTIGGCLGPCALANVALLIFDGQALWFHSLNRDALVYALYDYMEAMLEAGSYLPPPPPLDAHRFTASTWQPRPDGQPVDDIRPRAAQKQRTDGAVLPAGHDGSAPGCAIEPAAVDRLIADMTGPAAAPRKNGELVFDAPWQGRAFGMAVALNEGGTYDWEEFRRRLIARIGDSEARGDGATYYEQWLAAFESLLADRGLVSHEELEERTFQFEFGERDEVY